MYIKVYFSNTLFRHKDLSPQRRLPSSRSLFQPRPTSCISISKEGRWNRRQHLFGHLGLPWEDKRPQEPARDLENKGAGAVSHDEDNIDSEVDLPKHSNAISAETTIPDLLSLQRRAIQPWRSVHLQSSPTHSSTCARDGFYQCCRCVSVHHVGRCLIRRGATI